MPTINAPYDGTDNATNYISVNFVYLLNLPSLLSASSFSLIPSLVYLWLGSRVLLSSPRFQEVKVARLVPDPCHVHAEDFIQDDLPHQPSGDAGS